MPLRLACEVEYLAHFRAHSDMCPQSSSRYRQLGSVDENKAHPHKEYPAHETQIHDGVNGVKEQRAFSALCGGDAKRVVADLLETALTPLQISLPPLSIHLPARNTALKSGRGGEQMYECGVIELNFTCFSSCIS